MEQMEQGCKDQRRRDQQQEQRQIEQWYEQTCSFGFVCFSDLIGVVTAFAVGHDQPCWRNSSTLETHSGSVSQLLKQGTPVSDSSFRRGDV